MMFIIICNIILSKKYDSTGENISVTMGIYCTREYISVSLSNVCGHSPAGSQSRVSGSHRRSNYLVNYLKSHYLDVTSHPQPLGSVPKP